MARTPCESEIEHLNGEMASFDTTARGMPGGTPSPWFARIAADLLEAGNTKEALRICVEGTRVFPRYATGRLILGKCYESLGSHVEAMLEFRRVFEMFPDNPVIADLVRDAGKREQEGFEVFAAEREARLQGRKDRLSFEEYVGTAAMANASSVEQIIQQLGDAPRRIPISSSEPTVLHSEPDIPPPSGRLVTATLAEIYASQGEFDEAIEAYRTLVAQRPGSAERYQKRLAELEELKRGQQGLSGQ